MCLKFVRLRRSRPQRFRKPTSSACVAESCFFSSHRQPATRFFARSRQQAPRPDDVPDNHYEGQSVGGPNVHRVAPHIQKFTHETTASLIQLAEHSRLRISPHRRTSNSAANINVNPR